ncbi:MAG TPA: diphthamide synthesis protein [Candidatus Nanoarchaeia archaeon]|nr:diphthamide synthesis protein [Candidatus Nanoarchaeia archaeon]
MKLFHVLTKYDGDIDLPAVLVEQLPPKIVLLGTVQFAQQMPAIKKQLEDAGKVVEYFRGVHDVNPGQILGCDIFTSAKPKDAFLYVGDGLFHPTALLYGNEEAVFYYNPFTGEIVRLTQKDLQAAFNRKKGSLSTFYISDVIGVLVTTKPGQNNLPAALELKKRLEADGKQVYIFLEETLNMLQLDNFPFVQCWVNTACPRIIEDTKKSMINLWDLRDTVMKGFAVKVV